MTGHLPPALKQRAVWGRHVDVGIHSAEGIILANQQAIGSRWRREYITGLVGNGRVVYGRILNVANDVLRKQEQQEHEQHGTLSVMDGANDECMYRFAQPDRIP